MTANTIGRRGRTIGIILVMGGLFQLALCQPSPPTDQADQPLPSYEVATIKPSDDKGFHLTLRMYILSAFGLQLQSSAQLIGPDWINTKSYDIHGKPPDSLRDAMAKMTGKERDAQNRLMEQSLLADRFKLKYHFEMREIQGYQLVIAKGGVRLKEDPDSTRAAARVKGNGQMNEYKGTAVTMDNLVMLLTNAPEMDGRPVTNNTGLTGRYDFTLNWSSLVAANSADSAATSSNPDVPSLFTAVQEQLGLRLVAAKTRAKVVVIDHIEPPSEN